MIAWLLFQRPGLDAAEKSVIVATLKNDFSISKVKEALRLTWPNEGLRKRDSGKNAAMFSMEEEALLFWQMRRTSRRQPRLSGRIQKRAMPIRPSRTMLR